MFTKKYLKTKPICKVNFKIFKKDINAESIRIVGEWNDWDREACPMKKLKNGDFSYQIDLEKNRTYQFRYLVDNKRWFNDKDADAYCPSPFPGIENGLISV